MSYATDNDDTANTDSAIGPAGPGRPVDPAGGVENARDTLGVD